MDEAPNHPDDRDLVNAARTGDREAIGALYGRYHARLCAFAARYIGSQDDVHDLVHDAFLAALQQLHRYDDDQPFLPWLRGVCRNHVFNWLRRERTARRHRQAVVDQALMERVGEEDVGDELVHALRDCIGRLAPHHQELVKRRYVDGTMVKDIAADERKSENSVAAMLKRIRGWLRDCLEGDRPEVTA